MILPPALAEATAGPPTGIGWDEFTREVLELYAPPIRAIGTQRKMRQSLSIVAALGVRSTSELTPSLIARLIKERPPAESPNTTHSLLATVRAACNYAEAMGYCSRSPFAVRKTWVRRSTPARKRHHSREEISQVLTAMRSDVGRKRGWAQWRAWRLYALAATVAYTGLRRNEALFLRVEDVLFSEQMLMIVPRAGNRLKTERSAQPVPIPDALLPVLAEWVPHLALPDDGDLTQPYGPQPADNPRGIQDPGWLFPNSFRTGPWVGGSTGRKPLDRMKRLGERAGVEGFTFLSLRHSWATAAEYWGLSDAMIQRVLRHTNTQTQWHYRHADADNIRAKVRSVGFGHEVPGGPVVLPQAVNPMKPPPVKAVCQWPKLDQVDADEMRRLREGGWSYKRLCERFGVSKSTVHYTVHQVIHRSTPDGHPA